MIPKFYSGLSKDFSLILNDADDFDVIIQVGENQNMKEFRAHSVILRARCPYFKAAFSAAWINKKNSMIEYKKPNINPTGFEIILKYMYTGEVDLTKQSGENILGLLVASDELLIEELFKYVQNYLIENQSSWVKKNFTLVLNTVFKLVNCKTLQDYCLKSICLNPQPFITSNSFLSLDKDILYGLLKREDLQIKEVVAWDYLIKWGIQQTPDLTSKNNDIAKWNNKDYKALESTLNKFIPLIRFTEISSAEFFDKVRPFKAIIPNHIFEQIMEFYMKNTLPKTTILPPRIRKNYIESKIIDPKLISIIINWINKKDAKAKNNLLYNFDLIYRGSRDGISNDSFTANCNLQKPILVLVKCRDSVRIFGGYTPVGFYRGYIYGSLGFNNNEYIPSTDSFIFSFERNDDTQNMKLSRVISHQYAICNNYNSHYGFNFGGDDLFMQNEKLDVYDGYNYECNINGTGVYTIEEIEAFRVVKQ